MCKSDLFWICLYARYATNQFSKQYHPTTGVEFYLKRTTLPGQRNLALKLWDLSGSSLSGTFCK
jgi:Ras-related protein Rab-28